MSHPQRIDLAPNYSISRLLKGGWQLAGGHGGVDRAAAIADMSAYYEAGITTFDCADIYTGVEELIGDFRREHLARHGKGSLSQLRVHTKFVPDLATLHEVDRIYVRTIIERSLRRLGQERLDLVQFHWWDYAVPGCMDAARWLDELREEGKIDLIGGTNFDTPHTEKLAAAGVPLVSMQVQYSLLDARPENALIAVAKKHDIHLLIYGTVAGGFLGDRWLGLPEPQMPLENRSLTKYKLIIDDFGGWDLFQTLLRALRNVADRHSTDIATIASRTMLDLPQVAAVIVGARSQAHLAANLKIADIKLTEADRREIAMVLAQRRGPDGDTFELERDRTGRHGNIMKYNLSRQPA